MSECFGTIEDLLPELNTRRFQRGAKMCVRYTQSEGREAGFFLTHNKHSGFGYPVSINTGLKTSLDLISASAVSVRQGMNGSLPFPRSDFDFYREIHRYAGCYKFVLRNYALDFHTHPEGYPADPSFNDLENLYYLIKDEKIVNNPLSVIVSAGNSKKSTRKFTSTIFQLKKDFKVRGRKQFFKRADKEFNTANFDDPLKRMKYLDSSMVLDNYYVVLGYFTIGKGFSFDAKSYP